MNRPDFDEFAQKEERLTHFMDECGYDAMLMGTTANFSWLSCGGSNQVIWSTEYGCSVLLVTGRSRYCIAHTMDAGRLGEQELAGLGFEIVALRWYEKSVAEKALEMAAGLRVLSDIPLPGVECDFKKFYRLHYPLTDREIERYRAIGREAEEVLRTVADDASPGMTGSEVETMLAAGFARKRMQVMCLIVGVDEEIAAYRHPIAWEKKIGSRLMMVAAARKYGLNVPITRMVQFGGDIPADTGRRFDAACTIAANTMGACAPGVKLERILALQKGWYRETGFSEEWRNHFIGGVTGYIPNDSSLCMDGDAAVEDRQTFNWFVTITGVNVEDTMMAMRAGREIFTSTGLWPVKRYPAGAGAVELPQILVK